MDGVGGEGKGEEVVSKVSPHHWTVERSIMDGVQERVGWR